MAWKGTLAYATSSNQTIADDTETAVIFGAEAYDHLSAWAVANPTRITIPTSGKYRLAAGITWSVSTDTSAARRVWFRKNGSAAVQGLPAYQATADGLYMNLASPAVELSAGDYIEVVVWQNNAADDPAIVADGTTFVSLEQVPASFKGALVRTNANINFPANNGTTQLDFTHEEYDTDGFWAVGLPRRLVVPSGITHARLIAGCRFSADMEVGANDVNVLQIFFLKDGNSIAIANGATLIDPTDTASYLQAAWVATPWMEVTAAEYFEVALFSNHTGSHQVLSHEETFFAIESLSDVETEIGEAASTSRRGGGWAKQVERETKPCPKCFGDGFIHYVDPRAGNYQRMSLRACNHLGCRNGRVEVS
jgi:hypothetical protein